MDAPVLKALEPVLQHRAVDLLQDVEPHPDLEIGRDTDYVGVKRGVVQLTERQAVGDHRLPTRVTVRKNVSGFEQFVMTKSADGAALLIGAQHALAETALVEAPARTTAVT